jgi:putative effector of murein hydrolase
MTVCAMMAPSLAFARATGTRCAHTSTVGGCIGGGIGIRGSVSVGVSVGVGVGVCAHTRGTARTHTHATVDTISAR